MNIGMFRILMTNSKGEFREHYVNCANKQSAMLIWTGIYGEHGEWRFSSIHEMEKSEQLPKWFPVKTMI